MSDSLRSQIHGNMNAKGTDELLDIWQTNNRTAWSDEAFEVIKDILQERGVTPAEQNEPVYEIEEEMSDDGLEEWEAKILDDENQPEFYDTLEVITLKNNIDKTAKAVIVVNILTIFTAFEWFRSLVGLFFQNRVEFTILIYIITFIVLGLSVQL